MTPVSPEVHAHYMMRMVIFWIVLVFISVISTVNLIIYRDVKRTSEIGDKSTCVLIRFLDGSAQRTRQTLIKEPHSKLNRQRIDGLRQTVMLAKDLRATGVDC